MKPVGVEKIPIVAAGESHVLRHPDFPRSSAYDPRWVFAHEMGPNVLWLTEWLTEKMDIRPGMRVLDMGCGMALSSIFLAREFGATVWANDLWISASENWKRIREAGMEERVFPIHAEAHSLPYAEGFFDCVLSMDSYQYYGTDDLYMGYFHKFVKPGGRIGIVVPGLHRDFESGPPEYLTRRQRSGGVFWEWECRCFHTADWWRKLWSGFPFVEVTGCDAMENGGRLWLRWEEAVLRTSPG